VEFIDRASELLLDAARKAGVLVQVVFRPGFTRGEQPEQTLRCDQVVLAAPEDVRGRSGAIHPALAPEADDIIVTKHRVSAFTGTEL